MVEDRTEQVMAIIRQRAVKGMTVARTLNVKKAKEIAPYPEPVEHPYATGTTRREIFGSDIEERGWELRCRVINPMEYGAAQEFGPRGSGRKWRFKPHIRPALDYTKTVFKGIIDKAVFGK